MQDKRTKHSIARKHNVLERRKKEKRDSCSNKSFTMQKGHWIYKCINYKTCLSLQILFSPLTVYLRS